MYVCTYVYRFSQKDADISFQFIPLTIKLTKVKRNIVSRLAHFEDESISLLVNVENLFDSDQ
jgi:hypothetical protein